MMKTRIESDQEYSNHMWPNLEKIIGKRILTFKGRGIKAKVRGLSRAKAQIIMGASLIKR